MFSTGDIMQIHLSKPGGQREGPYTLEQIIQDLAANRYRDTDYWAWHEGLPEWVPLYLLPGIPADADSAPAATPGSEPEEESAALSQQVSSGMPASALEQIFMFTTGDGPSVGSMSHAVGTTRAFMESEAEGAMSSLAMAIAGTLTALLAPLFVFLFL